MSSVTRSVSIEASPEVILDLLLKVEDHPSWQKEVEKIEILQADPQGRPVRTRTYVSAMGQKATYVVGYNYPRDGQFEYHLVEGDVMTKNDFICTVTAATGAACQVTVTQDLDIKWPLPGFMIDQIALKGVKDMLKSLAARAEQAH
ncbi:SRPBCC family protein [Cryptosporangium aurantiacum]|uniref:Ribosome association toxin PasT (RatA) of the RatAB toxin-antitoxin module n=1 Tax=Cryptosporangium aurantiacum TaxID=134849 RepID=A0A1M7PFX5_9ACTN|nr:SRPBCC family protein [Cryptosporangium aurantiacum]SHN15903.1 Ribosome association toxin PasT (RatA) of the RatAB toxin-antitoxin module [Cryptosporangium aurantiacum]